MAQSRCSLSWDTHRKNICDGLSILQQNGEFVDMTLAADGHLVKVHQLIMALASPYIKELIRSAECSHPVIFLNKISYSTLCSILEYIYTGEALVAIENLKEFAQAGRELHIKGLDDMNLQDTISIGQKISTTQRENIKSKDDLTNVCYFEISEHDQDKTSEYDGSKPETVEYSENKIETLDHGVDEVYDEEMEEEDNTDVISLSQTFQTSTGRIAKETDNSNTTKVPETGVMQYTVSNQGNLQMILNRFMYYLKHTNKDQTRQWRCVDYLTNIKCPARVLTRDNVVIHRISAHTHPFHDKRILKKVRAGAIFSAIQEAEQEGNCKKHKPNASDNTEAE